MTEAQLFNCPSCNAPLSASEGSATIRCSYCFNTVVVPHSMQEPVASSPEAVDMGQIHEMLDRGQKMEAVKLVSEQTGLGLKEAQEVVEAVERGEDMQVVFDLLANFMPATQSVTGSQTTVVISTAPEVHVDAAKVGKAAGIAGLSITCVVIAAIVVILLLTLIPLYFVFKSNTAQLPPGLSEVVPGSMVTTELQFGEEGIGPGQLTDPRTITADRDGNIYVGDYSTGRLQSFDAQGNFRWLVNLGEDNYIDALEIDQTGALLMVSRGAIRRFDPANGTELDPFPNPSDYYFEDLSIAPDGRLAVIVNDEDVRIYDSSFNELQYIPQAVSTVSGDPELDADIDMDGLGNIYILGGFNSSVFKYTPEGRFANRISSEGEQPGQLTAPGDLAVDGQGRLYVSDFNGVQVFDPSGLYLDHFDPGGFVFGLNFDLKDKLYTISNMPRASRYALNQE